MAVLVVIAAAVPAAAEFVMEQRDGVLYVKNVVSPPPAIAARAPAAVAYRELIRAAAARYTIAPELV
jgi:hypothetical protein